MISISPCDIGSQLPHVRRPIVPFIGLYIETATRAGPDAICGQSRPKLRQIAFICGSKGWMPKEGPMQRGSSSFGAPSVDHGYPLITRAAECYRPEKY